MFPHLWLHMGRCVHMCLLLHVQAHRRCWVSGFPPLYFLRQGYLPNPEVKDLVCLLEGLPCLCLLSALSVGRPPCPLMYETCVCWRFKLTSSCLPTIHPLSHPSPPPSVTDFNVLLKIICLNSFTLYFRGDFFFF